MTARQYEREGWLPRFSLDRRITVLVLFLTSLVVGAAATVRIPVELFPAGFDEPFLWVNVPWSNAPSKEVLDKVTLTLEEELSTVRGVDRMITVSTVGGGRALLWFKHGTEMDIAYREVRDRVERAKARFPSDIDRVYVNKDDHSGFPVYMLGIAIDEDVADGYDLVYHTVRTRLARVDGVAAVEVEGLIEKEILIELDREKVASAALDLWQLGQDLNSDNFTLASGNVREGSRKLLLRSIARYDDLEALENRLVAPSVRLKDVATISYKEPERNFRVRAMSKPAVALMVLKEGQANVMDVSNAVHAEVQRLKADPRLSALAFLEMLNQGEIIDEALATLFKSGMIGGCIAVVVLLFFLRRIRLTVILALAIPLSILIGLTTMYFSGESLNLLTLLGLMICIGLLVDNSVVVAENIHRLHRGGMGRRESCIHGAGEVALAITMSTLTTIVVFMPVALVDGPAQFFLMRLALPVCVSVAASLLVALVFIPLCVYLTLPTRVGSGAPGLWRKGHDGAVAMVRRAYEQTFGRLSRAYGALLAFFLRRRLDLMLAIVVIFALTVAIPIKGVGPFEDMKVEMVNVQEEERWTFSIWVEMPRTSTLEETEEWFLAAEKVIEGLQEELDIAGYYHWHRRQRGEIEGWLNQPRTKEISPKEVNRRVKEALPRKPGVELFVGGDEERDDDTGKAFYAIPLNGEDPDTLDLVKKDLESFFARVEGVLGVKKGDDPPPNELGLVVDRDRAQRYDVNPQQVAGVVGAALMGMQLPKYYKDGKEIPVRVRFQEADRESLTELADFRVPTGQGELLALSTLTDPQFLPSQQRIVRRDKRLGRVITLELEEGKEEETRKRLAVLQAGIDLPEGISFGTDFRRATFDEDLAKLNFALLLSVVFIYLLMGFLFESFVLPLSIISTIPLSIIGVYWTHLVTGKDIDFLGVVAMVLLVGVVVNNGIVLIDYVNRLRNKGSSRRDALLDATNRRFRPIMMTAITTIGGLVPLALAGRTSIGLSYTSFSMTLIGGMTTATLLTLLVVPVFYTFFDDAREACSAALRRALGRRVVEST